MNERKAGVILSYINMGVNGIIMLFYVPMLLHYLTKEQFGVYQLIGSFISTLIVMDFGLNSTITRFLSNAKARKDTTQEEEILSSSCFLYLLVAIGVVLVGLCLYAGITPLYQHSFSVQELVLAKQLFLVLLFNFLITICGNLFLAVLFTNEKFVLWQTAQLGNTILLPLCSWGVLSLHGGALGLVLLQTVFNIAIVGIYYGYCRFKLQVRFRLRVPVRKCLWELISFSWAVFVFNAADQVYWRLGSIVLGAVIGAAVVANYAIGMHIFWLFVLLSVGVSRVFLPKLSADWARTGSLESHNSVFCQVGRIQFMVACLILVGFFFVGKSFILLWLGAGYEVSYWITLILMAGCLIAVAQSVSIAILQAMNKFAVAAYIRLFVSVLSIGVAVYFSRYWGEVGCAVASSICMLCCQTVLLNIYYRKLGLKIKKFFQAISPLLIWSVVAGILCWSVFVWWPVAATWCSFLLHGCCVVLIYGTVMVTLGFNQFERDLCREMITFVKQKIKNAA